MTFEAKLQSAKTKYPFLKWREMANDGFSQYTEENCHKARAIFDDLITDLVIMGEDASEERKLKRFQFAVESLNELNDECDGDLIETMEREDLCDLIDTIALKAGIDVTKYESDLAFQWREW